jgi:hemerythrin-like domain-containing protein
MERDGSGKARTERRQFLLGATAGLVAAGCATGTPQQRPKPGESTEAEVTPGEDLMQEHGVLDRILLIYEESARRIDMDNRFNFATLAAAAGIVRHFIEDYHEKNEELFVFPRLQSAGREKDLVATLLAQHRRGREITNAITQTASRGGSPDLVRLLRGFSRMYRPHAAREETVIFPAFRTLLGRTAYRELGERFEDKEREILGAHGFESTIAEVARLEQALDMGELARFTME